MAQNWAAPVMVRRQPDIFASALWPKQSPPSFIHSSWRPRYRFRTPCGGFAHQPIPGFVVIPRLAEQVRTRIGNMC
jgi:hypothetical protein